MDGFVVDAAGVASCLASARSVASSCGCAGGGAARWVDDARCACDADAAAESCDAVLARAPGRGVLVAPGGLQYGFTTALNDFVGHLAAACAAGEHLLYGGFLVDGTAKRETTPALPVEAFFDLDPVNAALRGRGDCARTRVLPASCAARHINATRCHASMDWGKAPLALDLKQTLPLSLGPAVAAARARPPPPAPYDAVHFNLDCDWLLYLERRNGTRNRLNAYRRKGHPEAMARALCGGGDADLARLGAAMAASYARATAGVGGDAPWLLVTPIGKVGHEQTAWVLDAYRRALPAHAFFESGARSRHRELNAAAELGLLLGARNFVGLWHSTFSNFAQQRFLRRPAPPANATAPKLICRCLRCCLSDTFEPRRHARFGDR